jgi:hypothetical protein
MNYKPEILSQFGIGNDFSSYPKQVCIFLDGLWFDRDVFKNSEIKVFVGGCEPDVLLDKHYSQQTLIDNHDKFDLILTRNRDVLEKCKNSKLFPFGSTWIKPGFTKLATKFEVSFLCGVKNYLPGHSLRHKVFNELHLVKCKDLAIKLNYTVDIKENIFNTSQYSIIIENSQCENYFTEKLIDCFITKTIPIYWGCPNIGDFFNKSGIINFKNVEDLITKINLLTPDLYAKKLDVIEENFIKAQNYTNFHQRVDKEILQLLK